MPRAAKVLGAEISPQSLADLRKLGAAYKEADKKIQKRMRDGIKAAAKPLGDKVIREGAAQMPSRGGLRARLQAARPGVTASLAARNVSVSVRITNLQRDALGVYDSGKIRHPVFGERRLKISSGGALSSAWVAQTVPPGRYSHAFRQGQKATTTAVNAEIAKALGEIAGDAQ